MKLFAGPDMPSSRRFQTQNAGAGKRGMTPSVYPTDGILLIDKPTGLSSAEVVRRIKAWVRPERVGHVGTLDPLASGLLPVVIGEATKLAPFLETADKEYHGIIQLGLETDTLDSEGQVTARAPVPALDSPTLARVEGMFSGEVTQTVPIFSAVKRQGQPLYKLARRGLTITPPARTVTIRSLRLQAVAEDRLSFVLVCSKGTYARALARDIGRALGSVALLAELKRTCSAGFSLDQSCALDDALATLKCRFGHDSRDDFGLLIAMRDALADLQQVSVDATTARRLRNGDASVLELPQALETVEPRPVKVLLGGDLIAIAELRSGRSRLLRVFRPKPGDLYSSESV